MRGRREIAVVMFLIMLFAQSSGWQMNDKAEAKRIEVFTIYKGKTARLSATINGKKKKTGKEYLYQVAKKTIATVTKSGKVKAKKAGTTIVILKNKKSKKKIKIEVKVVDYVKELRITSATSLMMKQGETKTIKAVVYPATAKDRKVKYVSSAPAIAKVNSKGVIQAVQSGMATISVTTQGTDKKGKKIKKVIYVYIEEETEPVPTPNIPNGSGTVIGGDTPKPTAGSTETATPTETAMPTETTQATSSAEATPAPTMTSVPTQPPATLTDRIKEIPSPGPTTLLAANFVVKDTNGISTLYFVNLNYQGEMHVSVDGVDMSSSNTPVNILHRMETEVTGKGVIVSVNPGNKKENQYYDEKYDVWRDILAVTRPTTSDAWAITNRRDGTQYRLMAFERDSIYGTPYGLIITEGDTSSKVTVY